MGNDRNWLGIAKSKFQLSEVARICHEGNHSFF